MSLAPRQMTAVFGLGMRLHVRTHTTFKNGVLRNRQQPGTMELTAYRKSIWTCINSFALDADTCYGCLRRFAEQRFFTDCNTPRVWLSRKVSITAMHR